MDFVKQQIQRIQQQLAGLNASQKMLTAALVAVMVMTLLYWGRYAGTADMVPLLDQTLSASDLGQIQQRLREKGVAFELKGDRLLVPGDRQAELYADLAWSKKLPVTTEAGFEMMVKKLNPWAPASERDAMFNRAKEITCAQLIGLLPEVEVVRVMIDPAQKRQIGSNKLEPAAVVTMTTRGGGGDHKKLAEAAGVIVKGAEAALSLNRISVVINDTTHHLRDPSKDGAASVAANGADQLALKQATEDAERRKIEDLFANIQNVLVSVSVKIDGKVVRRKQQTVDPKGSVSKVRRSQETDTTTNGGAAGEDPGLNPNAVANEPIQTGQSAGASGPGSTEHSETIENENVFGYTQEESSTGPGEGTVVSATVRVPQSHFVQAWRNSLALSTDKPTDLAAVAAYRKTALAEMEQSVRASAGMAPDANVVVAAYDDATVPVDATVPKTATMSIPLSIGAHGKEIALGGLALVSLFMVSMMVKRSAPAPVVAAAASHVREPTILTAGEALAGEAGTGNAMLDGMELDEDAVRTQQMLDQVSTMVKDNPDAAASLVKRWLNRD